MVPSQISLSTGEFMLARLSKNFNIFKILKFLYIKNVYIFFSIDYTAAISSTANLQNTKNNSQTNVNL